MKPQRFTVENYSEMVGWYKQRKQHAPSLEMLPKLGWIVPGVAASFAFSVEDKMLWSDGTITNPSADREVRETAVREIFDALLVEAKDRGFSFVISNTAIPKIADYAREKGARVRSGWNIVKDVR